MIPTHGHSFSVGVGIDLIFNFKPRINETSECLTLHVFHVNSCTHYKKAPKFDEIPKSCPNTTINDDTKLDNFAGC